jgi:hypothetical protein
MKCPVCGEDMMFMNGCGWDYDRWLCMKRTGLRLCPGEIELETTTYPEGYDEKEGEDEEGQRV